MKVAVLSDTHDHLDQLAKALAAVPGQRRRGAGVLWRLLRAVYARGPSRGLRRTDPRRLRQQRRRPRDAPQYRRSASPRESPRGNRSSGAGRAPSRHRPLHTDLGHELAASGSYDVVFCGHTHVYETARLGPRPTLLVNPGEVMGRLGAAKLGALRPRYADRRAASASEAGTAEGYTAPLWSLRCGRGTVVTSPVTTRITGYGSTGRLHRAPRASR